LIIQPRRNSRRHLKWPWVLTAFSVAMVAAHVYLRWLSDRPLEYFTHRYGFVPAETLGALARLPAAWYDSSLTGLVSALFVHADWLHLVGNLAYLWAFGITVERAIGHWGMALSFLLLGAGANLFLAWSLQDVHIPVIGASSGVSVLIGVYLGLFPVSRMGLWLPLGLYFQFARVPAVLVIGSWFTLQLIYSVFGPDSGTVGWWGHVAGFMAGVLLALCLRLFSLETHLNLQDN